MNAHPKPAAAARSGAPPANVYSGVYRALLIGMAVSTALFGLGLVLALFHHVFVPLDPAWMRAQYRWAPFWRGLARLDPTSLMLAATVVLVFTPVARVVAACLAFFRDGDYRYVFITGLVLAVIALTVVLGRLGLH